MTTAAEEFKAQYRTEQNLYAPYPEIAEENLLAITGIMEDAAALIAKIRRLFPHLKPSEVTDSHHAIEDVLGDLFADDWEENMEVSRSIAYPDHVPSFVKGVSGA